ncbi:mechanosensitive ion channel domain-containing protein [Sphingomonas sp.]|uniref:mechanosensitive ion channel domain-containing protein n=1 Tax=Sphingomonas sp. TaxID=28214 RepID=UPI0035C78B53
MTDSRRAAGRWPLLVAAVAAAVLAAVTPLHAQDLPGEPAPAETPAPQTSPAIATRTEVTSDADIALRIRSIFTEISALRDVQVRVSAGVVTLTGTVPAAADVARAEAIASRVAGVVTVQNDVARDLDVDSNLSPVLGKFGADLRALLRALPLIAVAFGIALVIGYLGYLLASLGWFWRRISPNAFLAELLATLIRFAFVMLGIVAGLEVLGATALLGAVLGGAGVIGIAIGFAVRDTVDNYVSSLMLSLRQPFRANDHVVIEGNEGRVVRLTSRATILMTLEGNHLRIPNATVFKAVILNYTRNPERRFDFDLGVDGDDDPVDAMATGLKAIRGLGFVLDQPRATAIIREVGDSNIVLSFRGWLDQANTDFLKGRSLALDAAKRALEDAGFALPEPIYRLRFDDAATIAGRSVSDTPPGRPSRRPPTTSDGAIAEDAAPDTHIEKLVADERAQTGDEDLLDSGRPIE